MKNNRNGFIVVCVVGQPGAGKDELANFFEKRRKFCHISTGNIIREEMRKKNIPTNRGSMRVFSQNMRNKVGNMYPANIAAERIVGNTVITGPRNVAEVEFFKNRFADWFVLVAVDAPIEVRYERVKNGRNRAGDDISFDEFKAQEEAEYNSGTHELSKLLSMADYVIDNSKKKDIMFFKAECIIELKISQQSTIHCQ